MRGGALFQGYVLLYLNEGAAHGRDLFKRLEAAGVDFDSGGAYRALRTMEDEGLLRSRWAPPTLGPRRRVYRTTAKGRRRLKELADVIRDERDLLNGFLDAAG